MPRAFVVPLIVLAVCLSCDKEDPIEVYEYFIVEIIPPEGFWGIIGIGDTLRFTGVVRDPSYNEVREKAIVWRSSNPNVASIDQAGLVTGISLGSCYIDATVEGGDPTNVGGIGLTVAGPPASIDVHPDTLYMVRGGRRQLSVQVHDAFGSPVPHPDVILSSEDSAIAVPAPRDDASYQDPWMPFLADVNAVGTGAVDIVASTGQFSAAALVSVEEVVFSSITSGGFASCAIEESGEAHCWGAWDGRYHQGGYGDYLGDTPGAVAGDVAFVSLSVGGGHICGINSVGDGFCWGNNFSGQTGPHESYYPPESGRPVSSGLVFSEIVAGGEHSCGIAGGGTAYCWGSNHKRQLGATTDEQCGGGKYSTARACSRSPLRVDSDLEFQSLSLGLEHTCAVDVNGTAYCWGGNGFGQLGDGTLSDRSLPTPVAGDLSFRYLTAGQSFTCGLTTGGQAFCWGDNAAGQVYLGAGTPILQPKEVDVGGGLLGLSAGSAHACAITASGSVMCWGSSADGRLGVAPTGGSLWPVAVATDLTFSSISAGDGHTCAMSGSGFAYCWGANTDGQLGVLDLEYSAEPLVVTGQPEQP